MNGKAKVVDFRGLALTLPATMPLSVSFDLAGASGSVFPDVIFLASILGPEQVTTLRRQLDADGVSLDPAGTEVLGKLVEEICASYGLGTGESAASE